MIFNETTVEELVKNKILEKPLDGNHGNKHPSSKDYVDSGIPFIMVSDINNGKINFNKCKFISKKVRDGLDKGFSKPGDVLLSHKATIGITTVVDDTYDEIVLTPQLTYYRVLDDKVIDRYYLKYYFDSKVFQSILNNWAKSGSTRAYLGITAQQKLPIRYPDIRCQKRIVKVLFNIDSKIKINNEINNNLYELAINYLNEKAESKEVLVSNFAKIQGGYAFKSKDLIDNHTKNRIIKIKNLRSEINADVINSQFVEDEVVEKLDKKFKLKKGDVTIAMTGAELGKTGFIYGNDNYYLNQRVGVIRGNNRESELYLNIIFLSKNFQLLLNSKGYGSAQPNVSTTDIENIHVSDITQENLSDYYKVVKPIYDKIISNSEEIINLEQLRDTLLPKLMNGEIDLDNIEI